MKIYLKIPNEVANAMEININLRTDSLVEENSAQLIYLSKKSPPKEGESPLGVECHDRSSWNSMYGSECLMKNVLNENSMLVKTFVDVFSHSKWTPTEISNICNLLQRIESQYSQASENDKNAKKINIGAKGMLEKLGCKFEAHDFE